MPRSITLIIPTRNRLRCLQRVLSSYLSQPEIASVLLVDDASDPPLRIDEVTQGLSLDYQPAVRVERLGRRHGQPAARNVATRVADAEWLLFSDDDVFLGDGYVASLLAAQRRSGADIVAGRRVYLQDGEDVGSALVRCAAVDPEAFDPRLFMANFSAPIASDREVLHLQTTALIRRAVALEIGWYEGYPPPSYREETDFYLRAAAAGYRLVFCAEAVCFHLAPSETVTGGQRARREVNLPGGPLGAYRQDGAGEGGWRVRQQRRAFMGLPHGYRPVFRRLVGTAHGLDLGDKGWSRMAGAALAGEVPGANRHSALAHPRAGGDPPA